MNLKINTSPKAVEAVNCILKQALTELENNEGSLTWLELSKADIAAARRFSESLSKAFLRDLRTVNL